MKRLKKVLALTLASAMVLSSMSISFAAEPTLYKEAKIAYGVEADALYELGLLEGYSSTEKELGLADELTREAAMKLMAVVFGWDVDMDATSEFEDVSTWAQAYVAAAVAKGVTNGIGEGQFGGTAQATGKQLTTWFLRELGYDQAEAYEKAAELGMEAGIITLAEALKLSENVLRADLAGVAYKTLTTTPVGEDATVIEKLIEANVVEADKAEDLGLIKAELPEVLAIEEINVLNLIQLEVVFNTVVDKETAEDEDNYSLTDVKDGDVKVANAELLEDGKTVILTLDKAAAQQDEVDVTVENVQDLAENKLAETTVEDIEFIDMTIPTVVDAEVVGNDTIKITFSEPVKEATAGKLNKKGFEVNGGKLYIKEVRLQNNNTEALVELYSDLKEGETTIEVDATTVDYAGFGVVKETLTVSVVEDEDAPVVVGYEDATPNGVTLIWSEDIELKDGDKANFYHTNSKNEVNDNIVVADIDGNKLELDFTTNNLPEGTAYLYVLKESVNDLWDNENTQEMIKIEVEIDVTAPEVEGDVTIETEDEIIIEFTEELDEETAEEEDNYTLLDSEGKEVKDIFDGFTYDNDSKKVTIDFTEKLSGEYTLVIENVEDLVGNVIEDTTLDLDVEDLTKPVVGDFSATLYNAGEEGQMVKIEFDEKMATEGKYSVLDLEKYEIAGTILADLEVDAEITLVDDGKAVEIEIASDETEDGIDLTSGGNVVVARVADAAGNYTTALTNTFVLAAQGNVLITDVKATSTKTVEITFADELVEFDAEDLVITTGSTIDVAVDNKFEIAKVETNLNEDGETVVTLTIDEDDSDIDFGLATPVYAFVVAENPVSHNIYDEALLLADNKVATDEITPELATTTVDGDDVDAVEAAEGTITLTFTEAINEDTLSILTFEVEDLTVTDIEVDGNNVILTVEDEDGNAVTAEAGTKVTQKYALADVAGNILEDVSTEVAK